MQSTDNMTTYRRARPKVMEIVKANPNLRQDEIIALCAAEEPPIRVSQSTISHLRRQMNNGVNAPRTSMTPFTYAREDMFKIIKANPRASQPEIVALAAADNIRISLSSVSGLRKQLRNGEEPAYHGKRHQNRQVKALASFEATLAAQTPALEHLFSEGKFEFTCPPATAGQYARSITRYIRRINQIVRILEEQGKKA